MTRSWPCCCVASEGLRITQCQVSSLSRVIFVVTRHQSRVLKWTASERQAFLTEHAGKPADEIKALLIGEVDRMGVA